MVRRVGDRGVRGEGEGEGRRARSGGDARVTQPEAGPAPAPGHQTTEAIGHGAGLRGGGWQGQAGDLLQAEIEGREQKPLSFAYYGQGIAMGRVMQSSSRVLASKPTD